MVTFLLTVSHPLIFSELSDILNRIGSPAILNHNIIGDTRFVIVVICDESNNRVIFGLNGQVALRMEGL